MFMSSAERKTGELKLKATHDKEEEEERNTRV